MTTLDQARITVNDVARTTAMDHRAQGRNALAELIEDALNTLESLPPRSRWKSRRRWR